MFRVLLFLLALSPASLVLAGKATSSSSDDDSSSPPPLATTSEVIYDFVGPRNFDGAEDVGDVSISALTTTLQHRFQLYPRLAFTVGVTWEAVWFGAGDASGYLPNRVQGVAGIAGVEYKFWPDWLVAAQFTGGLYSDFEDITGEDFSFSVLSYVGYRASDTLTFALGALVTPNFQLPVLPVVGVRWAFAPNWTLNAFMPKPALEYRPGKGWKIYAFGQLAGGTYRVAEDFGDRAGRRELNNKWLSYLDIRAGGGVSYEFVRGVSLRAEAGSSLYRELEFEGAGFRLQSGPAPFASAGLNVAF